jgi:hypothetical protein
MGNRRLGTKRLNALLKAGSTDTDSSYQAGAGIKDAVVSHTMRKEGRVIITEILVDLQGKAGGLTFHSSKDNGSAVGGHNAAAGANETDAIAAGVAGNHLMVWENDVHGRLFEAEVIVVEAPNGTEAADIDVEFATYAAGNKLDTALTTSLALCAKGSAMAAGDRFFIPADDADAANPEATAITLADQDGKGLYMTSNDDNPGIPYTQGKLQIILRGYDQSWGF